MMYFKPAMLIELMAKLIFSVDLGFYMFVNENCRGPGASMKFVKPL